MSNQVILTLFFVLCIGWMTPHFIERVGLDSEEVRIEIYLEQEEEVFDSVYDEEEKPRFA